MTQESAAGYGRVSPAALPALRRAIAQGRSAIEAATVARQTGYEAGSDAYRAFSDRLGASADGSADDLPTDEYFRRLGDFFAAEGWGDLEFDRLHAGVAALSSSSWAEASGASASYPSCHITTGMLADMLSRAAGTDLAVLEVECRASGDDRCRFLVGGEAALGEVFAGIRDGGPVEEAVARLG
jgi:predicted hydrocarbon binding protein